MALVGTIHPAPLPALAGGPLAGPVALVAAIIRRGDLDHTRRAYAVDLVTFAGWLETDGLAWDAASPDDLDRYREWLASRFARTTANRRLVVVRALYAEAQRRHVIVDDPAARLRGVRGRDDRDGGALTKGQAREVLDAIHADLHHPPRRLLARRDLAIVTLLLRTGIRRSELAGLSVGSLGTAQGHHVLTIVGKGNVLRTVKLPTDVHRVVTEWLDALYPDGPVPAPADPLFVGLRKGGHLDGRHRLSDRAVFAVVARRLSSAGLEAAGPHGLRATFVTLALEGGAPLHVVQHAAGHADPRTTERYWRRKDSLDDNAVDYVRL